MRSAVEAEIRIFTDLCECYSNQLKSMETTATSEAIENMRGFLKRAEDTRDGLIALLESM